MDLAAITTAPIDGVQEVNSTLTRFQHFIDTLKDHKGKAERSPQNITLSICLNDRNLKTFVTWTGIPQLR